MKKLLALVLALVMTLGLATVGANAALDDFSDASDVSYTEAMSVMNAVGVFMGSDGQLTPKAELTRAQAAKLIAYLDLGEKTAEALPAVQVYEDVPATHWAAKYIAYCTNAGIIKGAEANKFYPENGLSGYAFGAYLLAVLGYDRDLEGMNGANWEINTAKLMTSNSITSGIDKAGTVTLTREEGAQYCLNALKATMVEYENKGGLISVNGADIGFGASKAKAVTDTSQVAAHDVIGVEGVNPTIVQLGEKLYDGKLVLNTGAYDALGRPANKWTYKTDEVITSAKTPVAKFTVETKAADVAKALAGYKVKTYEINNTTSYTTITTNNIIADTDLTAIVNLVAGAGETIAEQIASLTKNGRLVEVFANSNNQLTRITSTRFTVAKVSGVNTNTAGDVTYTFTPGGSKTDYASKNSDDTVSLTSAAPVKGDYVTYAVAKDGQTYIVFPTTKFTGTQSAVSASEATIDGTKYTLATDVADSSGYVSNADFPNSNKVANYYLDQFGLLVLQTEAEADTNYAIVDEIALKVTSGVGASRIAEASLVFPDGSKKTVSVAKINDKDVTSETYVTRSDLSTPATTGNITWGNAATNTLAGDPAIVLSTAAAGNKTNLSGKIVSYTENSNGTYNIVYSGYMEEGTKPQAVVDATTTNMLTNNGVPAFGYGNQESATNATVYVVKTGTSAANYKFTPYTGFANVPSIKANGGTLSAYFVKDTNNNVSLVYIDATASSIVGETVTNLFYTADKEYTEVGTSTKTYTMNGVLNGENTTITAKDANKTVITTTIQEGTFYNLTITDGYVTAAAIETFADAWETQFVVIDSDITSVTKDSLRGMTWDNDTKVYVINAKGESAPTTVDGIVTGDTAYVVRYNSGSATKQNTIKVMYLVRSSSIVLNVANSSDTAVTAAVKSALAADTNASIMVQGDWEPDQNISVGTNQKLTVVGSLTMDGTDKVEIVGDGQILVDGNLTNDSSADSSLGTGSLKVTGTLDLTNTGKFINTNATVEASTLGGNKTKASKTLAQLNVREIIVDTATELTTTADVSSAVPNLTNVTFLNGLTVSDGEYAFGTLNVTITVNGTLTVGASASITGSAAKIVTDKIADGLTLASLNVKELTINDSDTVALGSNRVLGSALDTLKIKGNLELTGAYSLTAGHALALTVDTGKTLSITDAGGSFATGAYVVTVTGDVSTTKLTIANSGAVAGTGTVTVTGTDGAITISGDSHSISGNIVASAAAAIAVNGNMTLTGKILAESANATLTIANSKTLTVNGASAQIKVAKLTAGSDGDGTLDVDNHAANGVVIGETVNYVVINVAATKAVTIGSVYTIDANKIVNAGTVTITGNVDLTDETGDALDIDGGDWVFNGSFTTDSTTETEIKAGTDVTFNGTVVFGKNNGILSESADETATVVFNGTVNVNGKTVNNFAGSEPVVGTTYQGANSATGWAVASA